MDKFEVKIDQAARAAWMSYVGGMTQDDIATQLGVSRPGVQRLLALARQEGLVKVHIDHPISTCMALGSALRERFGLAYCDVVPADSHALKVLPITWPWLARSGFPGSLSVANR